MSKSDDNQTININRSVPVLGILGIVFVILKVLGLGAVANWSWWLVLLPFWIGIGVWITVMLFVLAVFILAAIVSSR